MAVNNTIELVEALTRGEFEKLLGTPEGQEIDFKRAPYLMDQKKDQWELAKDVAAFANAGGGFIVIGLQTQKHEQEVVETVTSLSEVPRQLVDVSRYRDVLAARIYPTPQGLVFAWYPDEAEKGLLLIRIPPAPESHKPLLVTRFFDGAGKERAAVGVPRRNADRVEWEPPERIHRALTSERIALALLADGMKEKESLALRQTANERSPALRAAAELTDEPCITLQIKAPIGTNFLSHFFGEKSIAESAHNWRGVRPKGFRIRGKSEPQVTNGGLIIDPTRWYTRISADGWFEFAAAIDNENLGWGMHDRSSNPQQTRINPLALVEIVYDCFRFANAVLKPLAAEGAWKAWIAAYGFHKASVVFRPTKWGNFSKASENNWAQELDLSGEPELDAFEALWRLLLIFGLNKEQVPFTSKGRVDTAAILRG